ncbi:MAG: 4Fe-4S binding protein [Chloroflexi bacterium]|nr:4Fe-4S binding protein [Chloroflexota bacterium]MCL5107676.1 4Fe-4S binding protein [Chloroflexota bacterium]
MRVDATASRCTGCKLCQLACALHQFGENNPKKTAILITSDLLNTGHYRVAVCDQCGLCEELCPAGAVSKVDGAYVVDPEECTYCYICVNECPQGAMLVPSGKHTPVKCISCGDCVELCPTSALAMVE